MTFFAWGWEPHLETSRSSKVFGQTSIYLLYVLYHVYFVRVLSPTHVVSGFEGPRKVLGCAVSRVSQDLCSASRVGIFPQEGIPYLHRSLRRMNTRHQNVWCPRRWKTRLSSNMQDSKRLPKTWNIFSDKKAYQIFVDLKKFVYENMNIPDWAHNLSRGQSSSWWDQTARKLRPQKVSGRSPTWTTAQKHGIYPEIWPDRPIYLDGQLADTLRCAFTVTHILNTTLTPSHSPTTQHNASR